MKTINKLCISLLCMFVIATGAITNISKSNKVFGGEIDVHGSVVTRRLSENKHFQQSSAMNKHEK